MVCAGCFAFYIISRSRPDNETRNKVTVDEKKKIKWKININTNHPSFRLTAYVVKSFRQALPYIPVEEKIILEGLQWLSNNQANSGSFPEVGHVSHSDMQGGSSKGLALTAYTLIAFLENQKATPIYRNTINKAIDYVVKNLDGVEDPYALAICSYALHLANHPDKNIAFNLLELKATTSGE